MCPFLCTHTFHTFKIFRISKLSTCQEKLWDPDLKSDRQNMLTVKLGLPPFPLTDTFSDRLCLYQWHKVLSSPKSLHQFGCSKQKQRKREKLFRVCQRRLHKVVRNAKQNSCTNDVWGIKTISVSIFKNFLIKINNWFEDSSVDQCGYIELLGFLTAMWQV